MKKITISVSKPYDVFIGDDLLEDSGKLISQVHLPCKVALFTDTNAGSLYSSIVTMSLLKYNFDPVLFTIEPGEESKNTQTIMNALNSMVEQDFCRNDMIVTLGGGTVGDIGGFSASLFMRGIDYVNIPTTFLSSIDASVGGKTGVNLASGKNIIGSFWQPLRVICDYRTMETLSYDTICEGKAEAIKCAVIGDRDLLDLVVADNFSANIEQIIERCINLKGVIVSLDEHDNAERQLLNFGHTFGHAIEKLSGYSISHGFAVSMGMVIAARIAVLRNMTPMEVYVALCVALSQADLPIDCPYGPEELFEAIKSDKKRNHNEITIVLPMTIGNCRLVTVSMNELYALLVQSFNEECFL